MQICVNTTKYRIGQAVHSLTDEQIRRLLSDPRHEVVKGDIYCFVNPPSHRNNIARVVLERV